MSYHMLTTGSQQHHVLTSKENGSRWSFPPRPAVVPEEVTAAWAAGTVSTHTGLETCLPLTAGERAMPDSAIQITHFSWPRVVILSA